MVARLLSPFAASALLEAARESDVNSSEYFRAVREFRAGIAGRKAFREGLNSDDELTLRLSATAAGIARDPGAVSALVALLGGDERHFRSTVSEALGLIGEPAVSALLEQINDSSISLDRRSHALSALRATGYRSAEAIETLTAQLQKASVGDHQFRANLLLAGAKLRVTGLSHHAIDGLRSDNGYLAAAAAKLLTEVPDESATEDLRAAFKLWSRRQRSHSSAGLAIRQIVSALALNPADDVTRILASFVIAALDEEGGLASDDMLGLVDRVPNGAGYAAFIEWFAKSTNSESTSQLMAGLVHKFARIWQPAVLERLATVSGELCDDGDSIAHKLIDLIIGAIEGRDESALTNSSFQIAALQLLVRVQAPDLVPQLRRLLQISSGSLLRQVLYILWVFGDSLIEEELWKAYHRFAGESDNFRYADDVIGTLSTCATIASRDRILEHIRTLSNGFSNLDEDLLEPLIVRNVLQEEDLAEIVEDEDASLYGRVACLRVLVNNSSATWTPLMRRVFQTTSETTLKVLSIYGLANSKDMTSKDALLEELKQAVARIRREPETETLGGMPEIEVAAAIAVALAHMQVREAVPSIEIAVSVLPEGSVRRATMLETLGELAAPSSLTVLLEETQSRYGQSAAAAVKALGQYIGSNDAREAIQLSLRAGSGGYYDTGAQLAALESLTRHDPELLFNHLYDLYRFGHLDSSARQWLALHLPRVSVGAPHSQLVILVASLMSDRDSWVREMLYQSIDEVATDILAEAQTQLMSRGDPWSRASAVRAMGCADSNPLQIDQYLSDKDREVRDAADEAAQRWEERRNLERHIELIGSDEPSIRCAAFFSIEEHGDEWTVWKLFERFPEEHKVRQWLESLHLAIQKRRRDEHNKRGREERN